MISVIVPIHNSIKYIRECIESILNSAYKDLDIICIDSGTDGTGDYLKEKANQDNRIRYIQDENNSYGYKVNLGIKIAKGEYISIVDSDDYIGLNMYSRLIDVIEKSNADFVKSDYYTFYDEKGTNVLKHESIVGDSKKYDMDIDAIYNPELLFISNSYIWSGLYKKSFITSNDIVLHESAGASYQDTGFSILTLLYAARVRYISEPLYYYRTDNPDSSGKSNSKIFTIKEEWNYIDYQIRKRNIANPEQLFYLHKRKMLNFDWNIKRLSAMEALEFSDSIRDEIRSDVINSKEEYYFIKACQNADSIQIYGAGIWGNRVYDFLEAKGLADKVTGFVISGESEYPSLHGVQVNSISEGFILPKDSLIIIAIAGESGKDVYKSVVNSYYRNVVCIDNCIKRYISEELKKYSSFGRKNESNNNLIAEIRNSSFIKLPEIFCKKQLEKTLYVGINGINDDEKSFVSFSKFNQKDFLNKSSRHFNNIFIYDIPTEEKACIEFIKSVVSVARDDGRIFIFADNKLGLDALCNISESKKLRYSRKELKDILAYCGLHNARFYSVFPGRILPQILISENVKPNEDTALRFNQMFYYPEDCILSEQELYRMLDENIDIHSFAPSYFIECPLNGIISDIDQVTMTMHRNPEKATFTVIRDKNVEKKAAYDSGDLSALTDNLTKLSQRGIKTADIISSDEKSVIMKKIDGPTGDNYLRELLLNDVEKFVKEFDRFIALINSSSVTKDDEELGTVLLNGYIDLIPLNTIYNGQDFVVIDQEYAEKDLPINAVIYRAITSLYANHDECEKAYPINCLYERYGLSEKLEIWKQYQASFRTALYGEDLQKIFTSLYAPNRYDILRNQKMLEEISANNTFNDRHAPHGTMPQKPYRIGYCAGVFDMFHIGHINLLKEAKKMCDYLIVGVVRDEDCERSKHKLPVIPFEQRLEIVGSCKYVDKAVEIPSDGRSSLDAFDRYHFDVQFSGSDYENDAYWINMRNELRKRGSDMIFFPYTEDINSTMLRERINR